MAISLGSLLIVDDEAAQLAALSNTLGQRGYATAGASSGEDALVLLEERRFDLLLTDLQMPGMDGVTLLSKAVAIDPQLVGIVMTGHGTIATAVNAMQAGALDYILKPFKLSAVLPVLTRALEVRRLRVENVELARRVQLRTAELEEANRELDAFAHSLSHDLSAPLRAINGFAGFLLEDHAAAMAREAVQLVEHIARAGRRGSQLVEDILRFSRLNQQTLSRSAVRIGPLIDEAVQELRTEQPDRLVDVRIGELPDMVTGDGRLLRQVFVNLLSNAFKFTAGRADARVEVGCELVAEERVFFVRDNGAGFDMQKASRLFVAFQRLHRQEEFAGTGVGLSLVKRIIHRHDGRIWAESELGKGAAFYFTLGA